MKSLLIVTEQFTLGGLETHICGEIENLIEAGVAVHLAVGKAFDEALLPAGLTSITYGLPLGPECSPEALLVAIDHLRQIIHQNAIECVHVHPFTSIIPAVAAAEVERVPYAITLHGPASMASYYGPIYDLLVKDIVLPSAPLIVAVSPEVQNLLTIHASNQSVFCIPNSVIFEESHGATLAASSMDLRWLVVSRLDEFKVQGIVDFCNKAKACGIPGVVIAGDGPAKQQLCQLVEEQGVSDYVELIGASTEVPSLIQRFAGVAGMGRVVLEGISARKPVVLVGYDGVKGVVDKQLLAKAAERNFSGRNLPTIDSNEFFSQLRRKTGKGEISEVFEFARTHFNAHDAWTRFLSKMSSLATPVPTALTGLYHSLSGSAIDGTTPYLYSKVILDRIEAVVCSKNYYDPRLLSAVSFCRQRQESDDVNQAVAERDGQIVNLNQAVAERDGQIASLNQAVAERDGQIVNLNQAVAERDGQIASLNLAVAERDGQIVILNQSLADEHLKYQDVMNSNSMKITGILRTARRKAQTFKKLSQAFIGVLRSQGPRMALAKSKNWLLRRQAEFNNNVQDLKMSNQEIYLINRSSQNDYISRYIESGLDDSHANVLPGVLFDAIASERKILVLPLSYPLELTQRPDHIVRFFADKGYLCLMLQIDSSPPFFKEVAPNRYLTNVFAGVISSLAHRKNVVLYITYPFFGYLVPHMPRAQCLYDVLDDLSVFSLNCDAMFEDHENLLTRSAAVMFSSKELMNRNSSKTKGNFFLVKNGVWVSDFQDGDKDDVPLDLAAGSFVVGYHGAISELLDWAMLEKIASIPNVKIVMIGPLVEFESYTEEILAIRNRVLSSPSVLHIQPVPYNKLKGYLNKFSIGLVPFVVNEKTNPVLPLKLFEYMAIGLPVCATRTSSLLDYSSSVFVGSPEDLLDKINEMAASTTKLARIDYEAVLAEADWASQVAPVFNMLDSNSGNPKSADYMVSKKVDIVNINFFDWDGEVLYKGGAERYVFDLACMMRDIGWSPRIIQNANSDFSKDFRGVPVVGVQTNSGGDIKLMSKRFREVCKDSDLVIASPADLGCALYGLKVIGINHGIYWDHKYKRLENSNIAEYKNIFDALRVAARVVAVDTNFINWTRTYDYSLAGKLSYIPNYFDSKTFQSHQKEFDGKIRVLYPRRLYEARGIFITLKAFDYLFSKYPELELHLVGQANDEDGKIVSEYIEQHRGRVIWQEFDMDEMNPVYQDSHIVLVPTLYAEGTSLSCIEAMATNNALIATNIGGLPNLVIDGFNGYLINPTSKDLIVSIESLLRDRSLLREMASNGVTMSRIFEKNNWLTRWNKVISEVLQ